MYSTAAKMAAATTEAQLINAIVPPDILPSDLEDVLPSDLEDVLPSDLEDVLPSDLEDVLPSDLEDILCSAQNQYS